MAKNPYFLDYQNILWVRKLKLVFVQQLFKRISNILLNLVKDKKVEKKLMKLMLFVDGNNSQKKLGESHMKIK